MLVGERMSHSVVYVAPDTLITDALNLMRSEHVRRLPVLYRGKLIGIISESDLLNASPMVASALTLWELSYCLNKLTVGQIMTREVITVAEDTPIEEAARLMSDHKVSGMPVMRGDSIVGMITETDLFRIMLELVGARQHGIRVTMLLPESPSHLARLTELIARAGGSILSLGLLSDERPGNVKVTCKIDGMSLEQVRGCVAPLAQQIIDIRENYLERAYNEALV